MKSDQGASGASMLPSTIGSPPQQRYNFRHKKSASAPDEAGAVGEKNDSELGCVQLLSPPRGAANVESRKTTHSHGLPPSSSKRHGGCSTVKSKRRRRSLQEAECGDFGILPEEILELVLENCGARELGALACASKYFGASGSSSRPTPVERVAKRRVAAHPRADGLEFPRRGEQTNYARILHFADAADVAMRTSVGIALGAFHTAVLGVAGAVPGPPKKKPVVRRTEARDFALRRGLHDDPPAPDPPATYAWGAVATTAPGDAGGEIDANAGGQNVGDESFTEEDAEPMFPTPSEEDQRDEHGMSVFAPIVEGTGDNGWIASVASSGASTTDFVTPAAAAAARERAASKQPNGRTLYTFGRGFHGQLGQGGYDDAASPAAVSLNGVGFADPTAIEVISAGASHCAALDPNGALLTWGLASSGELGHGGWTPIEVDVPRQVSSMANVKVTQIAAGANHTIVVSRGGGLYTCGRGRHGQLGHGVFHDAGALRRVEALKGMSVLYAVAGGSHSLCLTDCGSVWSWGACKHGQLGLGDVAFATAAGWDAGVPWPCLVETLNDLDEPIVAMAAGGHHTMFVTAGGALWACGRGSHGALGVGVRGSHEQYYYYEEDQKKHIRGPRDHLVPRLVPIHHKPKPLTGWGDVAFEEATREDGGVAQSVGFGDVRDAIVRMNAKCGNGNAASKGGRIGVQKKKRKKGASGNGAAKAVILLGSARARCGGPASMTQAERELARSAIRVDSDGKQKPRWVKVPCACGATCRVVHAAAGGSHSCVLTACGAVMTTGENAYGQLGHGDTKRRYAFTRVESLRGTRMSTVATGEDHTGAVGENGRLYLWGRGDLGQLGTGDGRSHWRPRAVEGVCVAPAVPAERFLGFSTEEGGDGDGDEGAVDESEMGGPNQHLTVDEGTAHAAMIVAAAIPGARTPDVPPSSLPGALPRSSAIAAKPAPRADPTSNVVSNACHVECDRTTVALNFTTSPTAIPSVAAIHGTIASALGFELRYASCVA
ncbi:uncharacterized protein MICPUCDRAFT_42406 [Micromonas pusilla CCMP1545]|uniref:Predicted protein n=1 Tax=Micromonas pusilla (strain CCMP1545) TaxID=564608 RepID=C1N4F2_MICPC|nr:uncharacterized protein MICPUCDRAFT_42406 [Micromonas pusilla CCMP1545]EEH52718.1 predicted protein [Micromonas pusilla CCMP1545]|eukprot:XP_003062779.1 predicted protein [Micromonas pusilla CCMP1545]